MYKYFDIFVNFEKIFFPAALISSCMTKLYVMLLCYSVCGHYFVSRGCIPVCIECLFFWKLVFRTLETSVSNIALSALCFELGVIFIDLVLFV